MVGSFGDISIFSLRSEKMIGVGEGGIISTKSKSYFNAIDLIASRNMPFKKGEMNIGKNIYLMVKVTIILCPYFSCYRFRSIKEIKLYS